MYNVPANQQETTDREHLRLLSVFHYVVGGLAALFACIPIIHLIMGLVFLIAPQQLGQGNDQPPAFIGWFLIILASCLIVAGWAFAVLVLLAGRFIARRVHYTYCFALACVECIFVPFGTVLGVFTILVLMRPTVKALFPQQRP